MQDKLKPQWEFDGKNIAEKDTGYFVVVDINCREDDIKHIVKCVNTHQALVSALRIARNEIAAMGCSSLALRPLEAALASVEGV